MIVEVCCGHLQSALNAIVAKADRLELCSALELGGITPHPSTISLLKKESSTTLMALIRPREGHFVYSEVEKHLCLKQIEQSMSAGADGIVFGCLNSELGLDLEFLNQVLKILPPTKITFHRAIDVSNNPETIIKNLIDLKIQRVLTSGTKATASDGKHIITSWIKKYGSKISIMPGSGISIDNVQDIIEITKAKEIHLSAKQLLDKGKSEVFNLNYYETSLNIVKTIKQI